MSSDDRRLACMLIISCFAFLCARSHASPREQSPTRLCWIHASPRFAGKVTAANGTGREGGRRVYVFVCVCVCRVRGKESDADWRRRVEARAQS